MELQTLRVPRESFSLWYIISIHAKRQQAMSSLQIRRRHELLKGEAYSSVIWYRFSKWDGFRGFRINIFSQHNNILHCQLVIRLRHNTIVLSLSLQRQWHPFSLYVDDVIASVLTIIKLPPKFWHFDSFDWCSSWGTTRALTYWHFRWEITSTSRHGELPLFLAKRSLEPLDVSNMCLIW